MSRTQQWRNGFEPAPQTYLNQKRWQDDIPNDLGGDESAWWESRAEIERKAGELGVKPRADEHFQWFKCRVAKAADATKWQEQILADLARTKSDAYAKVFEYFNGAPPTAV